MGPSVVGGVKTTSVGKGLNVAPAVTLGTGPNVGARPSVAPPDAIGEPDGEPAGDTSMDGVGASSDGNIVGAGVAKKPLTQKIVPATATARTRSAPTARGLARLGCRSLRGSILTHPPRSLLRGSVAVWHVGRGAAGSVSCRAWPTSPVATSNTSRTSPGSG